MTPDINIMRQEVSNAYSGPGWKKRVANMPDTQIIAIYFRIKEAEAQTKKEESTDGEQQTLF